MLQASLAIIGGFLLLVWGADRFVDGASAMAKNFRIPPMIIGLTIVSLGTSFPEMLISAMAAIGGNSNLGIGNALGSNIANIGLVLGCAAMVAPLTVKSLTLRRELPVLFLVMFLAFALMADGDLNRWDGTVLLTGVIVLLWWLVKLGKRDRHDPMEEEFEDVIPAHMPMKMAVIWFIVGLLVLLFSSRVVVWGAVEIAQILGISDLVIGLTIIAIGTSLPELVASIVSVLKNEAELAIGNVIGSNMFNLLAVLSMPALIHPQAFSSDILLRDLPVMFAFTIAMFVMAFGFRSHGRITRPEGALLVSGFCAYLYMLYIQA
jgi:cation:H+ antiporter